MKAFARKQTGIGGPPWRSDPISEGQLWRIRKEREQMGMRRLTDAEIAALDKGKAFDMLSELISLQELRDSEALDRENEYVGVDEDFRPDPFVEDTSPWELL